jgi:hypothetical protein
MKKVGSNFSNSKSEFLKEINPERIEEDKLNGYKNIFEVLTANIKSLKDQILLLDVKRCSLNDNRKHINSTIKSDDLMKSFATKNSNAKTPPGSPLLPSKNNKFLCSISPTKSLSSNKICLILEDSIKANCEPTVIRDEITGIYKNLLKKDYAKSSEKTSLKITKKLSDLENYKKKDSNNSNSNETSKISTKSYDPFIKVLRSIQYKRPNVKNFTQRTKKKKTNNVEGKNLPKNNYLFNIKCNSLINVCTQDQKPRSPQSSTITQSTNFKENINKKNVHSSRINMPMPMIPCSLNSEINDQIEEYDACITGSFYTKNISERDCEHEISEKEMNKFDTEILMNEIGYNCCGYRIICLKD